MAERLALVLATLLVLLRPAFAAGGGEFSYMTMNGVKAAAVAIQGIEPGFARYGLTLPPLQAAVESQLRQSGIEIVSYEDAVRRPDAALVQVKFRTNQSEYQFYFYNLALEVREKIPLGNAAGGFVSVLIWSDAQQGSVQPTDLPRITKVVDDVVAVFVREYQAQNAVKR
ncbi:MAG: hypothetical protein HY943_15340 [Gammaproteobacteria bacterium]|nr:hypothetical protein [Gammaproteobacteria bacterium]